LGAILSADDFSFFVGCCRDTGFTEFRFTGGEPLLAFSALQKCIAENELTGPGCRVYVTTNGTQLVHYSAELSAHPSIKLKVSLDSLDPVVYSRLTGATPETLESILLAMESLRGKVPVGINTVAMRETWDSIPHLIDYASRPGLYLKVLDLNDYADLAPGYWERNYVSTGSLVTDLAKLYTPRTVRAPGGFGIPMAEFTVADGSYVRIKDSRQGSTYSPLCLDPPCSHFPCQEGVYQLTLTSDGRLKVCRHRPDLGVDISALLKHRDEKAVSRAINGQMNSFFGPAFFHSHDGVFGPVRRLATT